MQVLIWTERLPPSFHWHPLTHFRGTEQFYVQTASYLASQRHEVTVAYDGQPTSHNGVSYENRKSVRQDKWDRMLVCNWMGERTPSAGYVVNWSNQADWTPSKTHPAASVAVLISQFHRRSAGVSPLNSSGIDKSIFHPPTDPSPRKRQVVYSSSPDRGGTWLADQWDQIQETTGYRLILTGYDSSRQTGSVAALLRESEYWIHPGLGVELFCLSAAEAQACGCVPIYAPTGALPETITSGFCFPHPTFLNALQTTLDAPWQQNHLRTQSTHLLTWSEASDLILRSLRL